MCTECWRYVALRRKNGKERYCFLCPLLFNDSQNMICVAVDKYWGCNSTESTSSYLSKVINYKLVSSSFQSSTSSKNWILWFFYVLIRTGEVFYFNPLTIQRKMKTFLEGCGRYNCQYTLSSIFKRYLLFVFSEIQRLKWFKSHNMNGCDIFKPKKL
jgi:hypothetical protein